MLLFGLFLFPSCLCSSCLGLPDLSLIILLVWKLSIVTESCADRVTPEPEIHAVQSACLAEGVTETQI